MWFCPNKEISRQLFPFPSLLLARVPRRLWRSSNKSASPFSFFIASAVYYIRCLRFYGANKKKVANEPIRVRAKNRIY